MKKLLSLGFILIAFGFAANATTYYFSASGDDANNGTSSSTPWKTLSKLNSIFSSLSPGDNILFNRGDVFYGGITISRSGSSGSPITLGAYGTGANPVITGFTNVTSWTNLGGNIWESNSAVSSLSSCNMVAINGVNIPMGRYPNSSYLTYESFSGNTSITSSALSGGTDWTGAEVVIRKGRWNMDRSPIIAQSGSTLRYSSSSSNTGKNNYGFFIQNDSRTLDTQNEWYYNPTTNKIRIYSIGSPQGVQVASLDMLVYINNSSYISFNNISLQGENRTGVKINKGQYISFQNCDFNFSGLSAIDAYPGSPYLVVNNCTFNNSNDFAINAGSSNYGSITSNKIQNSGVYPGMALNTGANYKAIHNTGNYNNIAYNYVDSTGFNPIEFDGDGTIVQNNFVNNFGFILDDGGGIYTYPSQGLRTYVQRKIKYNIVLNGGGAGNGTDYPNANQQDGIYLDGTSPNCDIIGNTVSNVNAGLSLNNAHEVNLDSNTSYNNVWQYYLRNYDGSVAVSNISVYNNILISRLSNQLVVHMELLGSTLPSSYAADNNYYARPIDDNLTIHTSLGNNSVNRTLSQWQSFAGQDAHSNKSPKAITTVNDLRFEFNPTATSKTISLDANYIDVRNVSYNGSITLAPYTSAVLIKNGPATGNQNPVANAGGDGSITLPTNTITLSGSGTDADGTITAYKWIEVSGPSTATINSPNNATTSVAGMVQGVYVFQLQVTDNNGATGVDAVQISVLNSSGGNNIAPVANAGGNGTITLPTNSVRLDGTGTDVDGTVTAYNWAEVSGPSTASITGPASASTTVTGMVQGVYVFRLQVTDNNGATGVSTVQITVLNSSGNSGNISPVANAGGDGSLTLPINSVRLDGKGTDVDGTITAYNWTQVSGPANATISSPNSASTLVNALIQGAYVFQLTVTDNNGASGSSTVKINVINGIGNLANALPVANAGGDGSLTLPNNSVRLDGKGTDVDGTITAYNWTQVSGPANATFSSPNSASTWVNGLIQGAYVFQLTVTDNDGASGMSTVKINVLNGTGGGANAVPVANAGGNGTITLPNNRVPLTGTGTDANGTITAYNWTQVSGPAAGTFSSPNSAATWVNGLVQGVYVFQLTVTDNNGASGSSTVKINVVNAALSSSSIGNNQSITLSPQVGIKAYPNPFINSIEINITSGISGKYKLMLIDASGKTVWTKSGIKNEGNFQQSVNTSTLQRGIYFLNVIQNNINSVIKLVK